MHHRSILCKLTVFFLWQCKTINLQNCFRRVSLAQPRIVTSRSSDGAWIVPSPFLLAYPTESFSTSPAHALSKNFANIPSGTSCLMLFFFFAVDPTLGNTCLQYRISKMASNIEDASALPSLWSVLYCISSCPWLPCLLRSPLLASAFAWCASCPSEVSRWSAWFVSCPSEVTHWYALEMSDVPAENISRCVRWKLLTLHCVEALVTNLGDARGAFGYSYNNTDHLYSLWGCRLLQRPNIDTFVPGQGNNTRNQRWTFKRHGPYRPSKFKLAPVQYKLSRTKQNLYGCAGNMNSQWTWIARDKSPPGARTWSKDWHL